MMEARRPMTRSFTKRQMDIETASNSKILTDESHTSIIKLLSHAQVRGSKPKTLTRMSNPILKLISERSHLGDFLFLLKKLDQSSILISYRNLTQTLELVALLKEIETRLMSLNTSAVLYNVNSPNNQQPNGSNRDEFEVEMISLESAKVFRMYGGVELMKRILLFSLIVNQTRHESIERSCIIKVKCKCIQMLNRLICLPNFGKLLVQDLTSDGDTLIQYLFSLLLVKETRLSASQLIESILLHLPLLNLSNIKNLTYILEKIDDDGLACLCKIFAVTLSDLDFNEAKYWGNQKKQPKSGTNQAFNTIRDSNHDILLNTPDLLHRLVNLVRRKDYSVRYSGAQNELENWIRYIDEALSDDDDERPAGQRSALDELSDLDEHRFQPALLAASKLNNFVHVLYTLSLLLMGKDRKKVQKSLAKLKLASALNSLFDYLIWNCKCEYPQENANQIRSHICPEVAVKIQFLRLVHSFCDNSEFKRVILSKDEIQEILQYNHEALPSLRCDDEALMVDCKLRCTRDKVGLLSKIVHVIKQEPFSASFRFWLTRAIESFLRGGTFYADQLFLINRGIVQDTLQNILAINFTRPKEVLQNCFDMLGELIKFNIKGFSVLNGELHGNETFDMFLRMINHSLVDSNMFLRSIFLSIDFFESEASNLIFKMDDYPLLVHFYDFEKRIKYICRMINIINVQNLSQENVSCLNTTIVVLMLANKKDQMAKYLNAINSKSINMGLSHEMNLIANFKDLLQFWQAHYLQKDKDCIGLELNSKIDFKYWRYTVELLLDPDVTNECSLSYYIDNQFKLLANANKIEDFRSD